MKFRLGLIVGLAIGYYYGAKAGRKRYEQMEEWLKPIRESELYRTYADSLNDAFGWTVRETKVRAKEAAFGVDPKATDPTRTDAAGKVVKLRRSS